MTFRQWLAQWIVEKLDPPPASVPQALTAPVLPVQKLGNTGLVGRDATFADTLIDLDGSTYTGCTFERCRIRYGGGDLKVLSVNRFSHCNFEFIGPAQNTLVFLKSLYHGGGKDLVESILADIRTPFPPKA